MWVLLVVQEYYGMSPMYHSTHNVHFESPSFIQRTVPPNGEWQLGFVLIHPVNGH